MTNLKSLLAIEELDADSLEALLRLASQFSTQENRQPSHAGFVAFLSERESVRTRLSVHRAAFMLGIQAIDLDLATSFYADPARRYDHPSFVKAELASMRELGCVALTVRMRDHSALRVWRDLTALPLINGCSDEEHPLQALADALVLIDSFGQPEGLNLTLVGNGSSPVFRSLLFLSARLRMNVVLACPPGYGFSSEILRKAGANYSSVHIHDLAQALAIADVIYADSIAYRRPTDAEAKAFAPYRLTVQVVARHAPTARVMHCLPHSDEIDSDLIFQDQSLAMKQVAARIPATAAVIHWLSQV